MSEQKTQFEKEISQVINRHSMENGSNTPDYILAAYLNDCLTAYNKACIWRAKWFSPEGVPRDEMYDGPKAPHEMGDLTPQPGQIRGSKGVPNAN